MFKTLPLSLLQATQNVIEHSDVLDSCVSCGAVLGSCIHSPVLEDIVGSQDIPDSDEPEEQLSGKKEEVEINPEYKTFTSRRPN